jgi:hypothetical protein
MYSGQLTNFHESAAIKGNGKDWSAQQDELYLVNKVTGQKWRPESMCLFEIPSFFW